MSNTNTTTGNKSSISNFIQNMNNTFVNNQLLDKMIYNGVNGIPYAVIGMVTVVASAFTYVTYSDYANEFIETTEEEESLKQDITFEQNRLQEEELQNEEEIKEREVQEEKEYDEEEEKEQEERKEKEKEYEETRNEEEEKKYEEGKPEQEKENEEPKEYTKMGGKSCKKRQSKTHKIDRQKG